MPDKEKYYLSYPEVWRYMGSQGGKTIHGNEETMER